MAGYKCKRPALSWCDCWRCDRDSLTIGAIYRMMRQGKIGVTQAKLIAEKKLTLNIGSAIEIWARHLS